MVPLLLLSLAGLQLAVGAELSRCCSGGSRHFSQTSTCSGIKAEGSTLACAKTASICCLRTLLDDSCDQGTATAKGQQTCAMNINALGGGLKKECCECCLLAKELLRRNEPCVAPNGFAAVCLKSFNKCCAASFEIEGDDTMKKTSLTERPADGSIFHGDRCSSSKCEHLCNDRGGDSVECSCRNGFDLAADGFACVDRDECSLSPSSLPPCDLHNEDCINTPGGYVCRERRRGGIVQPVDRRLRDQAPPTRIRPAKNKQRTRILDDDVARDLRGEERAQNDAASSSCPPGWRAVDGVCRDVDECMLLMDDCLSTQRCLNTPGSYKCIRTLSCGTGYALDSDTEDCIDVDECNLGTHDCGPLYACRNTQGSYRCDIKKCDDGQTQNPVTGECTTIQCPLGYSAKEGSCHDINECLVGNRCHAGEECLNTPGGFRCQMAGSFCSVGYSLNPSTGFCDDIDECSLPRACDGLQCTNLPGSFKCRCKGGFEFNERTKRCEDIDECEKFHGHVCDALAKCRNTIGSFYCDCKEGFQLGSDGRSCVDVDECRSGIARCDQKCINIPGSYQCICDRGFALSSDGKHCDDIDECTVWTGSGSDLCMGGCINTPGSYKCNCPSGYTIQSDGRTCQDIDECAAGQCQGNDRICVNTLGDFKCHHINCPVHYNHDKNYKNRCMRSSLACMGQSEEECKKQKAIHVTFQYIGIPRHVPISSHRPSITIFTIRGPSHKDSTVQFELSLNNTITEAPGVMAAVRANFLLQKGEDRNTAIVALRDSLDGPQQVNLELSLRLHKHGHFHAKYIANLIVHVSRHKKQSTVWMPPK